MSLMAELYTGQAMIKETIRKKIEQAVHTLIESGALKTSALENFSAASITRCKDKRHGDFATNAALILAKSEGKAPLDIASMLKEKLALCNDVFSSVAVAGPGFINLELSPASLSTIIPFIAAEGQRYGTTKLPLPKKALIEFVSANPTGGLHLGHARGAFVGDALARLLSAAGFTVTKEFYINDTGNQVSTLGRTIHKRYRELFGEKVAIESGEYPGDYVIDIARALKDLHGEKFLHQPEAEWLKPITEFGIYYNLSIIRRSLNSAGIEFDEWFSEQKLHDSGALEQLIEAYQSRQMLYDADVALGAEDKVRREESKAFKFAHLQEGGLFLKTTLFGDTEDRILKRRDGRFVYLTADLAYHHQKFLRGYDVIVDVFGGDHAGHIGRINAGMEALGHDISRLKFVVVQMMRLIKGGQEVKFSKRAGEVVGLDDLINEVGKDVARFVFLMRANNTQFDLDLDLVTERSSENPVYYVQYGHARMATILARAKDEAGVDVDARAFDQALQSHLSLPEERDLLLKASELAEIVTDAASSLEPHRVIYFCQDLIKNFHSYFTKYRHSERIISDDKNKTRARLCLVFALKQTIFNALDFIGISAPDRMDVSADDLGN